MAISDVPFIHSGFSYFELSISSESARIRVLTKDWTTGFWTRSWWIPWQVWLFLMVILENSFLRLGRRKEEETREHCLSKPLSPTSAITQSMMSCGISSDFAMCALTYAGREIRWRLGSIKSPLKTWLRWRRSHSVVPVTHVTTSPTGVPDPSQDSGYCQCANCFFVRWSLNIPFLNCLLTYSRIK